MADLLTLLRPAREDIRAGVVLLPGFFDSTVLRPMVEDIVQAAPFCHMQTPGGRRMRVAITNCGTVGWVSDRRGYRYASTIPGTGQPWPSLPPLFQTMATAAAEAAGFPGFFPDSCLINRYEDTASLSPHQDKNEKSFDWPIVSFSLGRSALFQLYGTRRGGPGLNIPLADGDALVFGGPARLAYHGVQRLLPPEDAEMNDRINLTFRRAL